MANPRRKGRRDIHIFLPDVVMKTWEEAWIKEAGYLPFNLTHRLEMAIMHHARELERRAEERKTIIKNAAGDLSAEA